MSNSIQVDFPVCFKNSPTLYWVNSIRDNNIVQLRTTRDRKDLSCETFWIVLSETDSPLDIADVGNIREKLVLPVRDFGLILGILEGKRSIDVLLEEPRNKQKNRIIAAFRNIVNRYN